MGVLNTM